MSAGRRNITHVGSWELWGRGFLPFQPPSLLNEDHYMLAGRGFFVCVRVVNLFVLSNCVLFESRLQIISSNLYEFAVKASANRCAERRRYVTY